MASSPFVQLSRGGIQESVKGGSRGDLVGGKVTTANGATLINVQEAAALLHLAVNTYLRKNTMEDPT